MRTGLQIAKPTHLLGKLITALEDGRGVRASPAPTGRPATAPASATSSTCGTWPQAHVQALRHFDEVLPADGERSYEVINLGHRQRHDGARVAWTPSRRWPTGRCGSWRPARAPATRPARSPAARGRASCSHWAPEFSDRGRDPRAVQRRSAAARAAVERLGQVVGDQADLPGPGAEAAQRRRRPSAASISSGGVQASRRTESGADQVLRRQRVLRGGAGHHLAAAGQPGRGDRVALGPAVRRRRAVAPAGSPAARRRAARGPRPARPARSGPAGAPSGRRSRAARAASRSSFGSSSAAAMIAASGSTRPGAESRRAAMPSRAYHSARTRAWARAPRTRWMPDVRRHGSGRGRRRPAAPARPARRTPPRAQSGLALPVQLGRQRVAQVGEQLDVQRGVGQPGLRQRPGGPVGGRVVLLQRVARAAARSARPGRPARSRPAGRPARCRTAGAGAAQLGQAGQVLAGGVQHPLGVGDRLVERAQVVQRQRVDQHGAGALRGAAAPGRPAGCSGSRRRARRRRPPARCRRRSAPPRRPARPASPPACGVPSRGAVAGRDRPGRSVGHLTTLRGAPACRRRDTSRSRASAAVDAGVRVAVRRVDASGGA